MAIIGLILSLAILIYLTYKRYSSVIASLVASVILGLMSGLEFWSIFSDYFFPNMVSFIKSWFLIFTVGAVFSELLTKSGSVTSIAYKLLDFFGKKNAILVVALITAILTLGGVNPYVQIFLIWPVCIIFSRETDTPRGIWIAAFYLGMLAVYPFPGNPGVCNVMISTGLDVSGASQPGFSILLTVIYFTFGYLYLRWRDSSWRKNGFHYIATEKDLNMPTFERESCPPAIIGLLPMLTVVVLYSLLTSKQLNIGLNGTNAVLIAMAVASCLCIALNFKTLKPQLKETISKSSNGGINPTVTAALITGYLGVVMESPAYSALIDGINRLSGGPFIQAYVACSALSVITGAGGSVAVTPVLTAFKDSWLASGVNVTALRPIMAQSCAGASIAPHSGGLNGVLDFTGSSMKESYGPVFWGIVVNALVTGLIGALLAMVLF